METQKTISTKVNLSREDENCGTKWKIPVCTEKQEFVESQNYILTPVSHLLSDVLSSVNNSKSSNSLASTISTKPSTAVKGRQADESVEIVMKTVPPVGILSSLDGVKQSEQIDLTKSPSLFSDDEKNDEPVLLGCSSDEAIQTITPEVLITKMKKVYYE